MREKDEKRVHTPFWRSARLATALKEVDEVQEEQEIKGECEDEEADPGNQVEEDCSSRVDDMTCAT